MTENVTPVVHFVGFGRDEYWSAVKVWGFPHYIHPMLDACALREIHELDTVVIAMTDPRPTNCRFRLQEEKKPYGRSGCAGCGKSLLTGLGNTCQHGEPDRTPAPQPVRTRPSNGSYPETSGFTIMDSVKDGAIAVSYYNKAITAEQAREAAHLLNQIAEYLESKT